MIFVFAVVTVLAFGAMVLASHRAVGAATALVSGSRLPPFFIGMTLLAVGTDLPEIANSIVASLADHGDVNVGDSVGSAVTQATLVLGLLPIVAGPIVVPKRGVVDAGALTVGALALVAVLLSDGDIGRADAIVLLLVWVVGSRAIYSSTAHNQQLAIPVDEVLESRLRLVGRTLVALGFVAGSAMLALWAIVGIADEFGAPEFLVSFFLASIGTSLPELVFDITALRRGEVELAIGDVIGSSFVDATLSIGIGPLIASTAVTTKLVVPAAVWATVAMVLVTVMMARIHRHDWRTGAVLMGVYAGFYVVLL